MTEYTHLKLNEDYKTGIAGYYTPQKEGRLKYDGREVLYVVGHAVIEASCCGISDWGYVLVPGFVVRWQGKTNDSGAPVSEVETIADEKARDEIIKMIRAEESVPFVSFW